MRKRGADGRRADESHIVRGTADDVKINRVKQRVVFIYLYHYYDKSIGPFVSLSDIPVNEAKKIYVETTRQIRPGAMNENRDPVYIERRHRNETKLKTLFVQKGGIVKRRTPHYMVIEHSPWLTTWHENSDFIKIHIDEFDTQTISFTYGDMFPVFNTMNPHKMSDREWHNTVYTYDEILKIIKGYGLPQEWNDNGEHGPSRYIEAHVWNDEPIDKYRFIDPPI